MGSDLFENIEFSSVADDFSGKKNNWMDEEKTQSLGDNPGRNKTWPSPTEDPGKTNIVSNIKRSARQQVDNDLTEIELPQGIKIEPAVGWLVCVDGVDKGRSFRLVKGNNSIGRPGNGKTYAVSLTDQGISRKGACGVIVYNEKSNQFFITPGDLTTNINPYLNEEILLSPKLLKSRSTLEIAGDILIFVPFCSDKFKWKFETPAEQKKSNENGTETDKKESIVRCERGHYYNSSIHDTCPYCEALANENDPNGVTRIVF